MISQQYAQGELIGTEHIQQTSSSYRSSISDSSFCARNCLEADNMNSKNCGYCGELFKTIPSRYNKRKFCSRKCWELYHSGKIICKYCGKIRF